MPTAPQLVLFTTDTRQIADLKSRLCNETNILVEQGNGLEISSRCGLDAMWMTPMMAHESGILQPLPPHVASIFAMLPVRRKKGLPPLLITGVSLVPGKHYTARYLSRASADALASAVAEYNRTHDQPIVRIGAVPGTLGLDDLNNVESFDAVMQAFSAPVHSKHPDDLRALDRSVPAVLSLASSHR